MFYVFPFTRADQMFFAIHVKYLHFTLNRFNQAHSYHVMLSALSWSPGYSSGTKTGLKLTVKMWRVQIGGARLFGTMRGIFTGMLGYFVGERFERWG